MDKRRGLGRRGSNRWMREAAGTSVGREKLRNCPWKLVRWHKVISALWKKGMVWLLLILFCCDKRKDMMEGYIRKKKNLCVGRSFCSAGCLCLCLCGMVNGKTHDLMFYKCVLFFCTIESSPPKVMFCIFGQWRKWCLHFFWKLLLFSLCLFILFGQWLLFVCKVLWGWIACVLDA